MQNEENQKTYEIREVFCRGCGSCVSVCPTNAISGAYHKPHQIDQELCNKCGECLTVCGFEAIRAR